MMEHDYTLQLGFIQAFTTLSAIGIWRIVFMLSKYLEKRKVSL
jgi:hypothetical protein